MQSSGSSHSNVHICKVCGRSLTSPYKLREHMMIHTGEKPHVCTECKQAFRTKPDLARHTRIHTGERPYSCTLCGQRFHRSDNLRGHMKVHKEKGMFPCQACGEQFAEMDLLVKHRVNAHNTLTTTALSNNILYPAGTHTPPIKTAHPDGSINPQKNASYTTAEVAVVNLPKPDTPDTIESDNEITAKGVTPLTAILHQDDSVLHTTKGQYGCYECGSNFYQRGGLAMHMKLLHGARSRSTSPSVSIPSSSPSSWEMVYAPETAYLCSACGQSFTTLSGLETHRSTMHNSNGKIQTADMNENNTMVDENMNEAEADKDGDVWMIEVDSDADVSEIEADDSTTAGKRQDARKLTEDANRAMGRDSVGDPISEVSSGVTPRGVASDGTVVLVGTEKPFGCEECGLCFAWKQDLNRHTIMAHSGQVPYRCTACGKGFLRQDRLISHIRVHTGKSPHTCEHCAKSFTASSSLKEHMKIHTGEKPHHCDYCGKDFRQKCVLTRHIRNVHKTNVIPGGNIGEEDQYSFHTTDGAEANVVHIVPIIHDIEDGDNDDIQPMDFSVSAPRRLSSGDGEILVQDGVISKSVEFPSSTSLSNPTLPTYIMNTPVLLEHLNNSSMRIDPFTALTDSAVEDEMTVDSSVVAAVTSSGGCPVRSCAACGTKFSSIEELSNHLMTQHVLRVQGSDSIHQQHAHPKTFNNAVPNVVIKQETTSSSSALAPVTIGEIIIKREDGKKTSAAVTMPTATDKDDYDDFDDQLTQRRSLYPYMTPQHNGFHVPTEPLLSPSFSMNNSRHHAQVNSKIPTKCSLCGLTFTTPQELNVHTDTHVKADPFFCSLCSDTFRSTSALDLHIKTHSDLIKNIKDLKDNELVDSAPEGGVACNICREQLEEESELSEHMKMHCPGRGVAAHSCSLCESSFETPELMNAHIGQQHCSDNPPGDGSDLRLYGCNFCFKPFKKIRTLVLHLKTHLTHKPFVCDMCGKAFSQKIYLTQHVRTHTGERPYMCTICGRSFTQKTQLTIHERSHRGETPYQCNECSKAFTNKSVLKLHLTTHLSLPPFRCTLCGRRFTQAGNVRRHISIVHKDIAPGSKLHYTNDNDMTGDGTDGEENAEEAPISDATPNAVIWTESQPLDLSKQLPVHTLNEKSHGRELNISDDATTVSAGESDPKLASAKVEGIRRAVGTIMDNDDLFVMGAYYNQQPALRRSETRATEREKNSVEVKEPSGNQIKIEELDGDEDEECIKNITEGLRRQKTEEQIENNTDKLSKKGKEGNDEELMDGDISAKTEEQSENKKELSGDRKDEEKTTELSVGERMMKPSEETNLHKGGDVDRLHNEVKKEIGVKVKEEHNDIMETIGGKPEGQNSDNTKGSPEEMIKILNGKKDKARSEGNETHNFEESKEPVQDTEHKMGRNGEIPDLVSENTDGENKDKKDEVNKEKKVQTSVDSMEVKDTSEGPSINKTKMPSEITVKTENIKRKASSDLTSVPAAKEPKVENVAIDNEGPSVVNTQSETVETGNAPSTDSNAMTSEVTPLPTK